MRINNSRTMGFTVIEVLVVILILIIIAGMVLINIPPIIARNNVNEAASMIMRDLEHARNDAVFRSANTRVKFRTGDSYEVYLNNNNTQPAFVRNMDGRVDIVADNGGEIDYQAPYGINISRVDNTTITVTSNDNRYSRNIYVYGVTGKARLD